MDILMTLAFILALAVLFYAYSMRLKVTVFIT